MKTSLLLCNNNFANLTDSEVGNKASHKEIILYTTFPQRYPQQFICFDSLLWYLMQVWGKIDGVMINPTSDENMYEKILQHKPNECRV